MPESNVVRALRRAVPSTPLPTGVVTFLLADIEGSVRLWESDRASMTRALARLDLLVDQATEKHAGARPVEQGEGDSFVIVFPSAENAVACAVELQRSMAVEVWPGGIRLRARLALHTGEAQLRDEGNYIGTTISRCGRLRSLAHGGQTLISPSTYELVADALPDRATLRDLGLQRIRDVPRPLRVYQLVHPELDDAFPPLRSLEVLTRHLPQQLTSFIGRETELHDVEAQLFDSRLVTLTGAGGCGKTRLAVRVAELAAERFPDGIWFVDLSLVRDENQVAHAVAKGIDRVEEAHRPIVETVLDHLRARRSLLVIDNCEHVVAGCAALADTLLRECPALTIVATSREPLRVEGETTWRVPSMSTPGEGSAGSLTAYDAVRLFIDRATRARPNFAVNNNNAPAVASICQQLDGIPLAVELAAARVRVLTPEQIASGLSDRFHLLRGGSRTSLPRQQTLTASVEWSHDLLDEPERVVLRRLSVFVGGFTLDAAEQVVAGDGIEVFDVLDLLTALVDKSLVVTGDDGPDGRYRLLETIRQYAAERAEAAGETGALRERHARGFARFARHALPHVTGPDQLEWLNKLEADHDNLRAALAWAVEAGDRELGLRIVGSLWMFWNIRIHWHEGIRWIDKLVALDAEARADLLALATYIRAGFSAMVGDLDEALPVMESMAEASQREGDHLATAWAFNQLGKYVSQNDLSRGRALLEESISAARASGDASITADSLAFAAWLELALGHTNGALTLLDESRRLSREREDVRGITVALPPRAAAAIRTGDLGVARAVLDECMELAGSLGDGFTLAMALLVSGEIAMITGDYPRARELIIEGIATAKETGSPFMATADFFLANLAYMEGQADRACLIYEETVRGALPVASWLFVLFHGAIGPAEWHRAAGRLDDARELLDVAIGSASDAGNAIALASSLLTRAKVARDLGDRSNAEADCHRALETFHTASARLETIAILELLGGLAGELESWREAARLLAAGDTARANLGAVRPLLDQRAFDDGVARVRDALDPAEFDAAWAEGEAMSLDDAVAYATRGRGERKRPSTGWESLTPTELDVVRLVAAGATNRDVGEQLFIATNTVKAHLSHVFHKLGVSSRTELASLVAQRGDVAKPGGKQ